MKTLKTIPAFAALILSANLASAVDYEWTGNAGTDWKTAGNWDPEAVPNLNGTDNATVSGEAIYDATPGQGDMVLSTGSTLTIENGGSWTEENGAAWFQQTGGNLVINNGGSFITGSMGQFNLNTGGAITINTGGTFTSTSATLATSGGGTLTVNGTYNSGANGMTFETGTTHTVNSGGEVNVTGALTQQSGSTLTLNNGGTLNASNLALVGGATFNVGGVANLGTTALTVESTTTMNVTAGATLTTTGNLIITSDDALFNMTGGTVNIGEFKPNANESIHVLGGVVNATLISFDATGTQGILELGAARINLSNGTFSQGIFAVDGDDYVNFTSISAQLFIDNLTEAGADLLLTDGRLRYNDAIGNIISTAQADGYLFTVVPEPSTYAAMAGLLALGVTGLRRRKS